MLRKRELQYSSLAWTINVAMVDAVLRSSIGRIRRRSRICMKQERESQCSNCRGVGGVEPPYLILPTPLPLVKIRPRGGVEFQPPHLSFAEVGMLFPSHFLLMQFLKYLQCDDLNVTTILIHIED